MNNKKYNNALKSAGIISYVMAVLMLCGGFIFALNLFDTQILVKDFMSKQLNGVAPDYYYTVWIIDAFFGCMMNIYAGRVYTRLSQMPVLPAGVSRVLNSVAIMQCLFIISIIPAIIGFVISSKIRKEGPVTKQEIENQIRTTAEIQTIAMEISALKQDLAQNKITQEQYDALLNLILERSANTIINKEKKQI